MATSGTPPNSPPVPPGVAVIYALSSAFTPSGTRYVSDPNLASQIFLLTASGLQQAAQNPAALSPALLPLFLRTLRQTAKLYFTGGTNVNATGSASLAEGLEAAFAAGLFHLPADTPPDPRAQTAAARLVSLFVATPVGGLNAAAQWIKAHTRPS